MRAFWCILRSLKHSLTRRSDGATPKPPGFSTHPRRTAPCYGERPRGRWSSARPRRFQHGTSTSSVSLLCSRRSSSWARLLVASAECRRSAISRTTSLGPARQGTGNWSSTGNWSTAAAPVRGDTRQLPRWPRQPGDPNDQQRPDGRRPRLRLLRRRPGTRSSGNPIDAAAITQSAAWHERRSPASRSTLLGATSHGHRRRRHADLGRRHRRVSISSRPATASSS